MSLGPKSYRKKPVEVLALQLGDYNAAEVVEWINGHYVEPVASMRGGPGGGSKGGTVFIDTLKGRVHASVGDFVIRGVQHEFYPCKPEIFEATYDAVPTPPAPLGVRSDTAEGSGP
jgi:hypothetical protein